MWKMTNKSRKHQIYFSIIAIKFIDCRQYVSRLETLKDRARLFRERKLKQKTNVDKDAEIKNNGDDLHKGSKITGIINSKTFNAESLWRERGFDTQ